MNQIDLNNLGNEILNLEKARINNAHWSDLTLKELDLLEDLEKKKRYRKAMNDFYMRIINTFSTLVSKDFKFSVPNDQLTYRIMATDYMNYFYNKGMTKEQIIQMMTDSKTTVTGKQI